MTIERKNYPELRQPMGAYVHATKHRGMLYVSGLTAFGTPAQTDGIVEQAKAVFAQMNEILAAEGVGISAVLKVTVFVTELSDLGALRKVMFATYGDHLPASSMVQVKALVSADLKLEIEAIVALE